jgi:hypothetical protein
VFVFLVTVDVHVPAQATFRTHRPFDMRENLENYFVAKAEEIGYRAVVSSN